MPLVPSYRSILEVAAFLIQYYCALVSDK